MALIAAALLLACSAPAPDARALARQDLQRFREQAQAPSSVAESSDPFIRALPVEYQAPRRGGVSIKVVNATLGGVLAGMCRARGFGLSFVGTARADTPVSLDFANQPFPKAVRDIAAAAGLVAVVDERRQQVTLVEEATYFLRVPAHLTERSGAQYSVQSNPGLPTPGGTAAGSAGVGGVNAGAATAAGASGANTLLSGGAVRSADALIAALTALVGGAPAAAAGRVQYVPESAMVAVRSNALGLRRAQDLMDEVARDSQQQVEVHAALVEVNLSRGLQYGIEWDRVIPTGRLLGAGSSMSLSLGGQGATVNVPPNVTTQSVKAVITALQSLTDVRVIAQPSAITLNHMDAVLYRGRQVPYLAEVSTTTAANVGATSSARVAYVPEGTSIALRASVIDAQRVDLRIAPQQIQGIAFRSFTFGANNTLQAPTFPLAQALLQLIVEQGRTYVIGGLNLETDQRDDSGVPGLAQVPLFGSLFTATQRGTSRSQLVLLLTARILPAPAVVDSLIGASL